MAELKTRENTASVAAFLDAIPDPKRRAEARKVATMMGSVTKLRPKMWGSSIVGYGSQHYRYASGREGDWFRTGFSPRKTNLTLYITTSFDRYPELMAKLGKYTTGVSCLHIKQLADVDQRVLRRLIAESLKTPLPGAAAMEKPRKRSAGSVTPAARGR